MRKGLLALLAFIGMMGCDDESISSGNNVTPSDQFAALCQNSGGQYDDGLCVCDGVKCDTGDLCNHSTKQCPVHIQPDQFKESCIESGGTPDGSVCKCSGQPCNAWQICVNNKCPVQPRPDFSQMCSYSGGSVSGAVCSCNNTNCDDGVLCNMSSGTCANESTIIINPSGNCNGFVRTCNNNAIGVGMVSDCVNGVQFQRSCSTVSCNEDNTDCGECLNNVTTCTNDENRVGKVESCTNGKKQERSCENVSCSGNACGTCLNYERSCVDEEITLTIEKDGKPQEVFKEIGRIYQCEDGEKGKLVLDCQNFSCKTKHKIVKDENGENRFAKDEAESAKRGFYVYVTEPLDKPVCGECSNFDLKCENDISDFATMYRCQMGQWGEIISFNDPAQFDPKTANINLDGYYPMTEQVQAFTTTMTARDSDWNPRVSCNADGTWWGVCHNSVQYCINRERGKSGYIVKCERGALVDYDGNDDNKACNCVESGNNNAGCSSSRNCYAARAGALGINICYPPGNEWDYPEV